MLQNLCKQSRAYLIFQNGLRGFLIDIPKSVPVAVDDIFQERKLQGQSLDAYEMQALIISLIKLKKFYKQIMHLKAIHPDIYVAVLKLMQRKDWIERLRNDHEEYSFYAYYYLRLIFEELMTKGKLHYGNQIQLCFYSVYILGEKTIEFSGITWQYKGQIDD